MAFEDTYAEVASTSYGVGYYDESNDNYAEVLQNLLPRGPAWTFNTSTTMYALLRALSYTYLRIEYRGRRLMEEYDPRTTYDMLPDWERVLDLPGTNPSPATTLDDRRAAVLAKLLGYGDPTPAYFVQLAGGLGFHAMVFSSPYDAFVAGALTGLPLTSDEWTYVWEVYAWAVEETTSNTALLEWTIDGLCQNHTLAVYRYYLDYEAANPLNVNLLGVVYNDVLGFWCAVGDASGGDAYIITSPNGMDWTEQANPLNARLRAVCVDSAGLLVAVGDATGGDTYVATSPLGTVWTDRNATVNLAMYAVAWSAGWFGAVGAIAGVNTCGAIRSSDGTTWNDVSFGALDATTLRGLATDGTGWVAVGLARLAGAGKSRICVGVDATAWIDVATANIPTTTDLYAVAHNGLSGADSLWIAVGASDGSGATMLKTSSPAGAWTRLTGFKSFALNSITYRNGWWVAVGAADGTDAYIVVSRDGITWTEQTNAKNFALNHVAYDALNRFVAVGGADGTDAYLLAT